MSHTRGILSHLVLITLYLISLSSADLSWYDCGPPLTKTINYQSVSISPYPFNVNHDLSLNVQAYIVDKIPSYTTTTIQVFRDGELFVNSTQVQDLCSILASNSISCPFSGDKISYTYEIQSQNLPQIPGGEYSLKITNELDGEEIACLVVSGSVDGVEGNTCTFTSNFKAGLQGEFAFQNNDPTQRNFGDWIQLGAYGPSTTPVQWGIFSDFSGSTSDVLPGLPASSFLWGMSGTLVNNTSSQNRIEQVWTGDFWIIYNDTNTLTTIYDGVFTLSDDVHIDLNPRAEVFSGEFTLTPGYSFFSQLSYPMVLGNLGTLDFLQGQASGTYRVSSSESWCTCSTDTCGVCGGDGSSCKVGTLAKVAKLLPARAIAAIVVSAFGVVVLAILISLYVKRRRFIKPVNDDLDLLDPQKPDYGTMAINEIMNEGPEDEV